MISNLYTITGHGSKGWTLSFGSCALLADLIDNTPTNVSILFKNFMEQILFLDCYKYIFFKKTFNILLALICVVLHRKSFLDQS